VNEPTGQPLRLDPDAKSADPNNPAFLARPDEVPVYHGFPVVPETESDGWIYGAISDFECESPQTEGDGFVVAPDGTRAGIIWDLDGPEFAECSPPDSKRWGVYNVRFRRAVGGIEDLVYNFHAVLPLLKQRYRKIQ